MFLDNQNVNQSIKEEEKEETEKGKSFKAENKEETKKNNQNDGESDVSPYSEDEEIDNKVTKILI